MVRCRKKCKCDECENLMEGEIVLINQNGLFNETRTFVQGFHCTYHGGWGCTKDLKHPQFDDDFVYL